MSNVNKVIFRIPKKKVLEKKLDILCSQIVRKRDKWCVTCGSADQPTAGHVFSRGGDATRWDIERNLFQQCWPCNYLHVTNTEPYYSWYINKFGQEAFDKLRFDFHQVRHWSQYELWEMYHNYRKILKSL